MLRPTHAATAWLVAGTYLLEDPHCRRLPRTGRSVTRATSRVPG